jgi:hypothetical protein
LEEFLGGNWILDDSSSLSPYDDQHFFIKGYQPGTTSSRVKWNFPPSMQNWMEELIKMQDTPEEKAGAALLTGSFGW